MAQSKYLDLQGLITYDQAIKQYIDNSTPESITTEEIEELFEHRSLMLRPSSTYEGGNVITDEQGRVLILSFGGITAALVYMEGTENIRAIESSSLETEISQFGQSTTIIAEEDPGVSLTFSYGDVEYVIDFIYVSMTPAVTEIYEE